MSGSLEKQTVTHYAAVYDVEKVNFSMTGLSAVSDSVLDRLNQRFKNITLTDQIRVLQRYSEVGCPVGGVPLPFFETLVVEYLTSAGGFKCKMRFGSARADAAKKLNKKSKTSAEVEDSSSPLSPLHLPRLKLVQGKVPPYADMTPKVLYMNSPFCDIVYKDEEGKLVCIQVGLGKRGQRDVTVGAFKEFCVRMGWGKSPSKDLLDRISYVFVPEPRLADVAKVKLGDGIGIDPYTVWHMNADYSMDT